MTTDQPDVDPQRAPGAFAYKLTRLQVDEDGLRAGHELEDLNCVAMPFGF